MRSDIAADSEAFQKSLRISQRAWKLYSEVNNLLNETKDEAKRRDLDSLLFSIGLYIDHGKDISEAGELNIRGRIAKITGRPASTVVPCEACERGEELYGAGDVLPAFHQHMEGNEPVWTDCPRSVADIARRRA